MKDDFTSVMIFFVSIFITVAGTAAYSAKLKNDLEIEKIRAGAGAGQIIQVCKVPAQK